MDYASRPSLGFIGVTRGLLMGGSWGAPVNMGGVTGHAQIYIYIYITFVPTEYLPAE